MEQPYTISDLEITGKKVLVRVDFNVPIEKGVISDTTRIRETLPTIELILKKGASKIILMSHLGRPKGWDEENSLKKVADELQRLLKRPVFFLSDSLLTSNIEEKIEKMAQNSIILLENLRFYEAEEKPEKDPSFSKKLAALGDIYINDAFGSAHRAHSSTATIAQFFPKEKKGIGLLMEKELQALGSHFSAPNRPFSALIGGAKVSSKLGVLSSLLKKADSLFIGGAMSYTFLKAKGIEVGASLVEDEMIPHAKEILKEAEKRAISIHLPIDVVVVPKGKIEGDLSKTISIEKNGIPLDYEGVDIGKKTIEYWKPLLQKSKTVFWNGPVGIFEIAPFNRGTNEIAHILASLHTSAFTVVGGGDSVSAIQKLGIADAFSHISTGGGASLEYIEKGSLPGIEALQNG